MRLKHLFCAGLIGLVMASFAPTGVLAQTLSVTSGTTSRSLNVSINRAVVVESDTPFAELSVANPSIADIATLSDRNIYILGKSPGRTTLTLLGPDGRLITNVEIRVAPDVAEFKERLREILPGEKIEVRTANDGIVLSGTVSSIQKLDRALDLAKRYSPEAVSNLMSVGGTQQVMLKVRFAEMSRSISKDLSVSLGLTGSSGNFAGAAGGNKGVGTGSFGNVNGGVAGIPLQGSATAGNGALAIGFGSGSLQASILIEALETKGLVRTLAEPNLTALSGQQAEFLAGGEVPIPVPSEDGIGIEYRPFGIQLAFTPTVVAGDVINLNLATSVSSLDPSNSLTFAGASVPAFSTRSSSTTVEMRDGESFAIAGLLQDDFVDLAGQVPWLGDVPVLGALFRSANYTRRQSELVIIITAHLVTPTRGDALVLPTDRIRPPTERELFVNGKVFGNAPARRARAETPEGEVARQDFTGSYGYVLE